MCISPQEGTVHTPPPSPRPHTPHTPTQKIARNLPSPPNPHPTPTQPPPPQPSPNPPTPTPTPTPKKTHMIFWAGPPVAPDARPWPLAPKATSTSCCSLEAGGAAAPRRRPSFKAPNRPPFGPNMAVVGTHASILLIVV